MDVLITIDTEISGHWVPQWRETRLAREIERDIFGRTGKGDVGILYQMEVMNRCGLKGIFFLESLFASVVGIEPLKRIVDAIRSRGHEVQLHIHPGWLYHMQSPFVIPEYPQSTMASFTRAEQTAIVTESMENLRRSGVEVCAFRAGDFDGNRDTLAALRANGIRIDSTVNSTYGQGCRQIAGTPLFHPTVIDGILEFPVSTFRVFHGGTRPAQVCACSHTEMEALLTAAWQQNWPAVVIVSHSFELMQRPAVAGRMGVPAPIRRQRFERLCDFLARHRDRFQTKGFADLTPVQRTIETEREGTVLIESARSTARPFRAFLPEKPVRVAPLHTIRRFVEQTVDAVHHRLAS
jgi:hypothetical protein